MAGDCRLARDTRKAHRFRLQLMFGRTYRYIPTPRGPPEDAEAKQADERDWDANFENRYTQNYLRNVRSHFPGVTLD